MSSLHPSALRASQQIYRRLLILLPADFRAAHAEPMTQLFADCCRAAQREKGAVGVLKLWVGAS